MDGLLIVDKPEGATSADVVRKVKRALHTKTGHLGTLDPFATGVLPVCIGQGTKVAQFLSIADKEYEGIIQLGWSTDTGDRTGREVARLPVPAITVTDLARIGAEFVGERMQTPPMYSAIKREGTPLYRLARQGVTVEREARPVRLDALELQLATADSLSFRVACSKGTYVRVLAEEIATALGTAGHLQSLRRTGFGRFHIDTAITLDQLLADATAPPMIGLRDSLAHLRELVLAPGEEQRARRGEQALLLRLPPGKQDEAAKLISAGGELMAVVVAAKGKWEYARVFTE
ncbi:MAG TPA: tRNA pseudouridine(55) synthase TruB [Terriglobales bacterium]|nr:tRNA pseudouridine(55) synthase TruB [Terriglobales bacterium]